MVKEVGERLRLLREGVKLSQAKIAKMLDTTQASINRYENAIGSPPLKVLLWYADYFDVSMDYIFGRTDKPQGKLYEYRLLDEIEADNVEFECSLMVAAAPPS